MLSVLALLIFCEITKVIGPTGDNQLVFIPAEDRILFESSILSLMPLTVLDFGRSELIFLVLYQTREILIWFSNLDTFFLIS